MLDALMIGGDGKIGQALVERLRTGGRSVVATTRKWPPAPGMLAFDLRYRSWLPLARITFLCTGINGFKPCDADPETARLVNTTLLVDAARYCTNVGSRIVYLSSSAAETHPDTVYGTTKREAEHGILPLGAAVYRFGPVAFPGRHVFPNEIYSPMNLSTLTATLANLFDEWDPGLHCLYNRDWQPE